MRLPISSNAIRGHPLSVIGTYQRIAAQTARVLLAFSPWGYPASRTDCGKASTGEIAISRARCASPARMASSMGRCSCVSSTGDSRSFAGYPADWLIEAATEYGLPE